MSASYKFPSHASVTSISSVKGCAPILIAQVWPPGMGGKQSSQLQKWFYQAGVSYLWVTSKDLNSIKGQESPVGLSHLPCHVSQTQLSWPSNLQLSYSRSFRMTGTFDLKIWNDRDFAIHWWWLPEVNWQVRQMPTYKPGEISLWFLIQLLAIKLDMGLYVLWELFLFSGKNTSCPQCYTKKTASLAWSY